MQTRGRAEHDVFIDRRKMDNSRNSLKCIGPVSATVDRLNCKKSCGLAPGGSPERNVARCESVAQVLADKPVRPSN